jgi:hypothetical protein
MPHDIIDNQSIKLADSIRTMLPRSEAAHFAVGYFFLSGLEAVADVLGNVRKLRLLIGNTANPGLLSRSPKAIAAPPQCRYHVR